MTISTPSASSETIDTVRFERACEWFLELREQPQSSEIIGEWLAWCRADPLNLEAFERARSLWQATAEVRAEDLALPPFPSPEERPSAALRPVRRRWPRVAIGGAMAAGLAATVLYLSPLTPLNLTEDAPTVAAFETKVGENRVTQLADGSTLTLGADSRVLTAFDEGARRLTLERGEAYFHVKHDRARPFIVTAGDFRVTAVGTAFNIRTGPDRVVVAVAEGMVSIEPPEVSSLPQDATPSQADSRRPRPAVLRDRLRVGAGQEVVLDSADQQLQVVRVEPHGVASWQTGRLEFTREPLRAVLSSVNRYSARQVTLDDPALGDLRFTGTVFADRVDDWIRGLPAVFPVSVREDGSSVMIESRERGSSAVR